MPINVVLLGFGTVGQGVYETITTHQRELAEIIGEEIKIKAILIKNPSKCRSITGDVLVTSNFKDILQIKEIDVAIEAIIGCEPAFTYTKQLLNRRIPVITANKEMYAKKENN